MFECLPCILFYTAVWMQFYLADKYLQKEGKVFLANGCCC